MEIRKYDGPTDGLTYLPTEGLTGVNPVTRVSDIMGWRLDLINNALRNMFITVVTAMVLVTAHFLPLSACRHKTRTEGGELSEFCLMFPYTVSSL